MEDARRNRALNLRARSPSASIPAALGAPTEPTLERGGAVGPAVLARGAQLSRQDVAALAQRVAAEALEPLPKGFAALAEAHPVLERPLRRLVAATDIPEAIKHDAVQRLGRALEHPQARVDPRTLARHLDEAIHPGPLAAQKVEEKLFEVDYVLEALDAGRVRSGSTAAVGPGPADRLPLSPQGPVVHLAGVDRLEDLDVVFVDPDAVLHAAEVKRSAEGVWQKLASDKDYLEKFQRWKEAMESEGYTVQLEMVIRVGDDAKLDQVLPHYDKTARELLEDAGFEII
jgi:hypothetical protein